MPFLISSLYYLQRRFYIKVIRRSTPQPPSSYRSRKSSWISPGNVCFFIIVIITFTDIVYYMPGFEACENTLIWTITTTKGVFYCMLHTVNYCPQGKLLESELLFIPILHFKTSRQEQLRSLPRQEIRSLIGDKKSWSCNWQTIRVYNRGYLFWYEGTKYNFVYEVCQGCK